MGETGGNQRQRPLPVGGGEVKRSRLGSGGANPGISGIGNSLSAARHGKDGFQGGGGWGREGQN